MALRAASRLVGPRLLAPTAARAPMAATRALPTHVRSLAAAAAAAPPPNVRRVANGDRVSLMFEIFDATTGEKIIDSGNQAADVVVGRGYAIPGIERALVGMAVGDHRTETMKPDQSFGVSDPRRIVTCVRPPNMNVEVGSGVVLNDTGEWARVVAVTDQQITVDLNHPLAGRTVTVNLSLLSISDEPPPKPNEITLRTLVPGDGKTFPRSGDKVHVHYTGTLAADGKEFGHSRLGGGHCEAVAGREGGYPRPFRAGLRRQGRWPRRHPSQRRSQVRFLVFVSRSPAVLTPTHVGR